MVLRRQEDVDVVDSQRFGWMEVGTSNRPRQGNIANQFAIVNLRLSLFETM